MRDILLLAVTILCSLTALRKPMFGMLAYVCFSLLGPHSMTWGFAKTFPHVHYIAICTIVGYFFSQEQKRFPRQREFVLLLAVWAMFGFSTVFAISADKAIDQFVHISKIMLMVVLSVSIINTEDRVHLLLKVIALSLGFYGFKIGLFVLRTGGQSAVEGPEATFLAANNAMGMALAMNVPILFYLLKIETHVWLRRIMKVMLIFSYPAVAGTFSRGAWVALAAITALMLLRSKHKILVVTAISLVVMMSPILLPLVVSKGIAERYDTLVNYQSDNSAQSRFWNWEFCARVGQAHPAEGGGFDFYSREAYAIYFPEFLERFPDKVWSCHSMWLTVFAEHGLPGFLLWVGLLGSCFLSLRQMRSHGQTHTDAFKTVYYADLLQMALVGFIISGTFLDIAYFEVYYLLVAVIIMVKERMRQSEIDASSKKMVVDKERFVLAPKRPLPAGS